MKNIFKGILAILSYVAYQLWIAPFFLETFRRSMPDFYKNNTQLIGIIIELILIIFLFFLYHKDLAKYLKNFKAKYIGTAFKYWAIGFGIMIFSNFIIIFLLNKGMSGNEQSVRTSLDTLPIYMIFSICIFAPLVEELVFRKAIRNIFSNKVLFVIISAIVFGAIHLTTNFNNFSDLLYLIPYGGLGACLAIAYVKTNNLFTNIFMHCFHNTLVVSLLALLNILPNMVS